MNNNLMKKNHLRRLGFTLLEVMIAMTILSIALTAILTTQSSSINVTRKAKELNIAGWLAHNLMTESEHLYEGKAFSEIPGESSENFPSPFQNYKWKREVKELKFPDIQIPSQQESGGETDQMRTFTQTISKYLSNSVREMVVTVSWQRGDGEMKVQVSTYLIDLNAEFNFQL